ncbi:hypothetical protein HRG_003971 [Hirsutella rhossiliensis]|uniref:Uncharacterized protein n=1 Tax=Hirsutella rhossiliensis TaxID=111463 RepID=A0A9P8N310_9HYPO|nr:uncharacterized protein HRG_03971 [Hirsutella rhossiliensis]KAH0965955.1 hypothetical protein HRG_03971 [Hirsutella rhossiliensis]
MAYRSTASPLRPDANKTPLPAQQDLRTPTSAPSGLVGARIRQLTSLANNQPRSDRVVEQTVSLAVRSRGGSFAKETKLERLEVSKICLLSTEALQNNLTSTSGKNSVSPASGGRRQDALSVFDLYGLSRPETDGDKDTPDMSLLRREPLLEKPVSELNESPGPSAKDLDKIRDERRSQKFRSSSQNTGKRGRSTTPAPVVGQDVSSMAQYRRHPRGTNLCLPSQGADLKPDPWPRLRKVDKRREEKQTPTPEPVPWSRRSLRRPSSHADELRSANEMPTPLTWRQNLKKTAEQGRISPRSITAASTPASQWRQNLMRREAETSRPHLERTANTCSFCDPTSTTPPQDCSHRDGTQGHPQPGEPWAESWVTPATLRVRQVKRSLAQKKAEEELEASKKAEEALHGPSRNSGSPGDGETHDGAVWEDARDCSSPECRGCSWRDRYMDLRGEVEKWKTELNSCDADEDALGHGQPSRMDKGVGDGVALQATPDDVGIEGLTIVVHMRYKDDLGRVSEIEAPSDGWRNDMAALGGLSRRGEAVLTVLDEANKPGAFGSNGRQQAKQGTVGRQQQEVEEEEEEPGPLARRTYRRGGQ